MKCALFFFLCAVGTSAVSVSITNILDVFTEVIPKTNNWIAIGLQLEINPADIDRIKNDHSTEEECFRAIIYKWQKNTVPSFTWNSLVNVLKSPIVQELNLAASIKEKYISRSYS